MWTHASALFLISSVKWQKQERKESAERGSHEKAIKKNAVFNNSSNHDDGSNDGSKCRRVEAGCGGGGWKVENPDGSNLVNEWYQDADGSWYYMGADGYMMTNTTTPDGYFVGEDGVWRETENTAAESLPAQQTAVPKNEESVKAVVEAYKNKFQYYSKYSCRLVNTGNPDIPVCVITSNHKSYYAHQYRDGVIDSGCYLTGSDVYYADGGNAFCEYKRKEDSDYESRIFWGFEEDGSYKVIGMSWKENNVYSVKTKVSSKEAYDQYNNSFGPLIKLDEGNTFPDLDAAYADYMAH